MTRVTQLIHDAGKYLLISVYPLPTHPTHNFTHNNGGNLETLPGWPKKLQHNRPAQSAGQWHSLLSRYRESRKKYRDVLVNPFLYSIIISIESCTFYPMENAYVLGAFSLFRRGPWRVNKIYLLIWFTHIIRFYTVTGEIVCLSKVRWYNFRWYGSNRRLPYHNRAQTSIINR